MKTYHFELILKEPPSAEGEERLFELFEGRVSAAVINGIALLYVHIEGTSLDEAVRISVDKARHVGLSVERVELDPETVVADAA